METEKKEVIFKIKNLKTWFPITKGFMKKVVGNVKAVDDVSIEVYKGKLYTKKRRNAGNRRRIRLWKINFWKDRYDVGETDRRRGFI